MDCFICKTAAKRVQTLDDWVEVRCPECGHYRVSGTLYAEMRANGQAFDVPRTRAWLAGERSTGSDDAPIIDTAQRDLIAA